MDIANRLMAIIGDIYEASYRPEHWNEVLRGVAEITEARAGSLIYHDNELEKANGLYAYNHDPNAIREYNEYYGKLDPSFRLAAEKVPTGTAIAEHQMGKDHDDFIRICGEYYTGFMVPYDIHHVCGAFIFNDAKRSAVISMQRGKKAGQWDDCLIQYITDLTPHLQRAFTIHKEFTRLRMQETALHAGLDHLLIGLVLYDEFLQPVYCNPIAESILKHHPAIRMQHDQIYAAQLDDTEKIRQGIAKALNGNSDDAWECSTAIGLRHPESAIPLPVLITPIHSSGLGLQQGALNAHAALFISDPEGNQPIMQDAICEAYDLTQTESEIVISIANGYSVNDIAELRGTASSTVKSQLKAIFLKLGVNKQTDLVKILLTSPFRSTI